MGPLRNLASCDSRGRDGAGGKVGAGGGMAGVEGNFEASLKRVLCGGSGCRFRPVQQHQREL